MVLSYFTIHLARIIPNQGLPVPQLLNHIG